MNPACESSLFVDGDGGTVDFAEMAHVIPASEGGPRDVPTAGFSSERRAEHDNIVVLCANCHTIVDKAPRSYPAELLRAWKRRHQDLLERMFGTPAYATRHDLDAHVAPLLAESGTSYRRYGPRAGVFSDEQAAHWRREVLATVIPNNSEILRVLRVNRHLLSSEELETVDLFSLHVREFEHRHVLSDWSAGTTRFPTKMHAIFGGHE